MRIDIIQEISFSGIHKVLGSNLKVFLRKEKFQCEILYSLNFIITKKMRKKKNLILLILNKTYHYLNLQKKNLNEKVVLVVAYLAADLEVLQAKLLKKGHSRKINKVSLFLIHLLYRFIQIHRVKLSHLKIRTCNQR